MATSASIPFYGRGGDHVVTLLINLDSAGQPPGSAELIGPDDTGARLHVRYRLDECRNETPPWRYTETDRPSDIQPPQPGSDDAARRVQAAHAWTTPAPVSGPDAVCRWTVN